MEETPQEQARQLPLGDLIRQQRREILARWTEEVSRLEVAKDLSEPVLRDHLPTLLDRIIQAVEGDGGSAPLEDVPDAHALARLDAGFDLRHVATEFALLRRILLDLWHAEATHAPQAAELVRVNAAIDDAVATSVTRFARASERTLKALDRLSAAALGTGDLDTFLPRLIQVLQETTEAVDSVVVLLRDDDRLQVRASVGLDVGGEGFALKVGESFAGKVAVSREPCVLRVFHEVSAFMEAAAIRRNKLQVLYGVPLLQGGEVLGVAHMGSRTAYDFSDADKQLFRAMAQRATSLIAQAQLVSREKAARAQAQHAFEQLRLITDAVPIHLLQLDREERILFANKAAADLWQAPVDQLAGRTVGEVIGEEKRQALSPYTQRVLQGERVSYESTFQTPAGEVRTFLNTYTPVRAADGTVQGFIATGTDITDRKQVEEALKSTAQFREQFIGVLGHDLRNPLGAIRATAQGLLKQSDLKTGQIRGVQRILNSADRMARMISDVLDFARGRLGGGIPIQRQRADLHELCRRVVDELHVAHPDRQLRLESKGDGWGEWDVDRVGQAVSNLVGNALQHGAHDEMVKVCLCDKDQGVLLEVKNRGKPIPQELLPVLFEPFRGSTVGGERGGHKGLGLGLWIAREIVRAHGGKLEVRSSQSGETTFSVWLPRADPG